MYCNHSHSQAGSENAVTKCTIYFIREHYDGSARKENYQAASPQA